MTKATIVASIAGLTLPYTILAQSPDAFKQRPEAPAKAKPAPQGDTHTRDNGRKPASPYGTEIPVFDPENETFTFMGSEFSLQDNRFADQFSGYLVQTQEKIEEAAAYRDKLTEIRDTLGHGNGLSKSRKLTKAYHMLGDAADYPADGKVCESLQNAVAMAEIAMRNSRQTDKDIADMKKKNAALVRAMDFIETRTSFDDGQPIKKGQGAAPAKGTGKAVGGVIGQENVRRRLELLAMMKKAEITGNIGQKLAKIQYQAMLMQLFMQRRFEHCIIGCRFYNAIFHDGEGKLGIEKGSDMHKFFSDTLGVQPTVAGLDSACNEFIGKAKKSADSVRNHIHLGQTHQATQRMVEAYAMGEHLTPIHTFDTTMRHKMHRYILDSKHLRDAAKVKNWQEAERYTKRLREQANDFRYIQAETAITGFKRASNFEVGQFYVSKQQKNEEKAEKHIANAIEFWPTNPKLDELENEAFERIKQGRKKLNELENYREEFKGIQRNESYDRLSIEDAGLYRQYFKMAKNNADLSVEQRDDYSKLHDEADQVFKQLEAIKTVLATADGLIKEKQYERAWEAITIESGKGHIAMRRIQDKLNQITPRARRFSELFDEADAMIDAKNYGSALSCYLKAKAIVPSSVLAKQGIEEMMKKRNGE